GRWVKAYVYRILANPAAMGTHQPQRREGRKYVPSGEPIPDYYPPGVREEGWRGGRGANSGGAGGGRGGRAGGGGGNQTCRRPAARARRKPTCSPACCAAA